MRPDRLISSCFGYSDAELSILPGGTGGVGTLAQWTGRRRTVDTGRGGGFLPFLGGEVLENVGDMSFKISGCLH